MGYHRAGFEVVGVDLNPKFAKRYPFEFRTGNALEFLRENASEFDMIHASPPCQAYSVTRNGHSKKHPELIEPVRDALEDTGKPYVIENVKGAPLRNPITLTWPMFFDPGSILDDDGTPLTMLRARLFESNVKLTAPEEKPVPRGSQIAGSYGGARRDKKEAREVRKGGYVPSKSVQQKLLGIDWMTQHGMFQSIPPAYTEYIGKQILEEIE